LLSTSEKRFIRYWQEQRTGGRGSYYALYIIVGTFIATLILCAFLFLFFKQILRSFTFWVALSGGLVISCIATIMTWSSNEKKYKRIIRREMDQSALAEEGEE
jgi:predicted tellurium resistance membrane protein TerC